MAARRIAKDWHERYGYAPVHDAISHLRNHADRPRIVFSCTVASMLSLRSTWRIALVALLAAVAPLGAQCMSYTPFRAAGRVVTGLMPPGTGEETSGVAASRHNPGVLWVHDDKGNGPYLIALRFNGRLAQQYLVQGVANHDWEDIAIGPGPIPGKSYIYIGDIGDNKRRAKLHTIIRVAEPDVPARPRATLALSAQTFLFRYPTGPRDAECLMIDPWDGTPWILTKEPKTTAFLFRYPMPLDGTRVKTLVRETTFFHPKPSFSAGDIAPDGRRIYFRNAQRVYWVNRPWGTSMRAAFGTAACSFAAAGQGNAEALAVFPGGLGLVAISEGKGATVWTTTGTPPQSAPKTIAASWCYGSGTAGSAGVPGIGTRLPPILGINAIEWRVFDARAHTAGFLVASLFALPDGVFRFAGGFAHVLPDIVFPMQTGALGTGQVSLGVLPNLPQLHGLRLHGQAILNDSTNRLGVALSRGLTLNLDR